MNYQNFLTLPEVFKGNDIAFMKKFKVNEYEENKTMNKSFMTEEPDFILDDNSIRIVDYYESFINNKEQEHSRVIEEMDKNINQYIAELISSYNVKFEALNAEKEAAEKLNKKLLENEVKYKRHLAIYRNLTHKTIIEKKKKAEKKNSKKDECLNGIIEELRNKLYGSLNKFIIKEQTIN